MSTLYLRNSDGEFVEIPSIQGESAPQESVLYIPQELTEDQKTQARSNIGAVSSDNIGGTVEVTSGDPEKSQTVLVVDPDADTINLYTAEEIDAMMDGVSEDIGTAVNQYLLDNSIKGEDGISPTVSVSKSGKVTTVSITDKNGTKTATINDGADGTSVTVQSVSESTADGGSNVVTFSDGKTLTVKNGGKGSNGVAATHSWSGTTLTITSASGTSSADLKGAKGDKGDAYTLTETDKSTIVNAVIAALPVYNGEVV